MAKRPETRKGEVIAPEERRLAEFWRLGKEVTFEDPKTGETLVLWVQKLTPAEDEICLKASRTAKARVASIKRLPEDSDEKFYYYDQLDSEAFSTRRKRLAFLVSGELAEFYETAKEQTAAEPRWSDDNYLRDLQAAWNDGLKFEYAKDAEHEDAKRVHDELVRYTDEVNEIVADRESELIYEIDDLEDEEVDRRVVRKLIEDESVQDQFTAFRNHQVYHATRYNDDRDKIYFRDVDELLTLPMEPQIKLKAAYIELEMGGLEGKE